MKSSKLTSLRRLAPLALVCLFSACGESYDPPPPYLATSPDCGTALEADTFPLPRGITVSATRPMATADGGVEIGVNYILPRTTQLQFATVHFRLTEPRGALLQNAKVLSVYQRPTRQRAEIVEIVNGVPRMLIAGATGDDTQFRYRLLFQGKLPQRFDLVTPDVEVGGRRYASRTFTYRWFNEQQAYSMCR